MVKGAYMMHIAVLYQDLFWSSSMLRWSGGIIQSVRLLPVSTARAVKMGLGSSSTSSGGQLNSESFVKQTVSSDCVVIFSSTTCGYCRIAKEAFRKLGVTPTVIEVNQRSDGRDIIQALRFITGMVTVPQVFVNGKCIGGGTETHELYQSGQLHKLVQQCASS